jgi:hypothetical protein
MKKRVLIRDKAAHRYSFSTHEASLRQLETTVLSNLRKHPPQSKAAQDVQQRSHHQHIARQGQSATTPAPETGRDQCPECRPPGPDISPPAAVTDVDQCSLAVLPPASPVTDKQESPPTQHQCTAKHVQCWAYHGEATLSRTTLLWSSSFLSLNWL